MAAPLSPRTSPAAGPPTRPASAPQHGTRVWDPSRDPAFFRIVARLFPPSTTLAMSVLLAGNDEADDEQDPAATAGGTRARSLGALCAVRS